MNDLKTIKVLASTVKDLNLISAMTGEKQYEVVCRLAKIGKKLAEKKQKN